jgi:hypothetical protein
MAPNMNIKEMKTKITICPAIILANNLIASANVLVKSPIISMGIITGYNHQGTPEGIKVFK